MSEILANTEVTKQLQRILGDALFDKSQRLAGFLRFVVETTLAGHAQDLKEYTIGVRIFERGEAYNPQTDPIVRIMAGRLRAKLAEYYQGSGTGDPILIELPRGGYIPRFLSRSAPPLTRSPLRRHTLRSVGRELEMDRLGAAFSSLAEGGRMIAVSGEAGIGKTTFAEEFLAVVESADQAFTARGRCSERLAETDAFAPLLDALDSLFRTGGRASALLEAVAPAWQRQVCPANGSGGEKPPPSQERLRREFAAFFEQLSRLRPVVLFLDDLHWADASTCDLLAYLGQRIRNVSMLIIATYRPGETLTAGHPFLPLRIRLEQLGICQEIPLSFLTLAHVEQYLSLKFPRHRFPAEFAGTLHERTEGSPLFLTDLLRYLVDTRVLVEQDGGWDVMRTDAEVRRVIPAGTHAMIGVKLASLTGTDREILLCGAIQGVQFDTAVVAQALSLDAAFVEDRLRDLQRVHRLVAAVEEQDRPGLPLSIRFRFVHVFYQNALYASLSPSRRAAGSLTVACVLAGLVGEASRTIAAELALLYESGRDFVTAAQYFLHAARNAARVFAYPEATLLCERGLRSLATLPESRQRDEQELVYSLTLGMALMSTRGYAAPEVEQSYRRARELCLKLNETRRLVPVLWALHTCATNAAKLSEALELAREMRSAADVLQQKEAIVESRHALGTTLAFIGRLEEAREAIEGIFEIAPVSQHEFRGSLYVLDPLVTSLSMLARLLTLMGEMERGMGKALESVQLASRLSHPHSLAYATFWVGWVLHARGEHDPACPHLEAAMNMGRTHELPLIVEWGRVVRGSALAHLGRYEEGIAEIRKSIERQDAMGAKLERPYCLTLLAEALLRTGATGEAIALCDQALELAERTMGLSFEAETHRIRGEAIAAGHGASGHDRAAVDFAAALEKARLKGCRLLELRAAISSFRCQGNNGNSSFNPAAAVKSAVESFRPSEALRLLMDARALIQ